MKRCEIVDCKESGPVPPLWPYLLIERNCTQRRCFSHIAEDEEEEWKNTAWNALLQYNKVVCCVMFQTFKLAPVVNKYVGIIQGSSGFSAHT